MKNNKVSEFLVKIFNIPSFITQIFTFAYTFIMIHKKKYYHIYNFQKNCNTHATSTILIMTIFTEKI